MLGSIIPVYENSLQGKGSPTSKLHGKIPNNLRLYLIKYIGMKYVKGKKLA